MKRTGLGALTMILFALAICTTAVAQSDSQSLGEYARTVRKDKSEEAKPAAKVYDNDNLPADPSINVVGASAGNSAATADNKAPNAAAQPNTNDSSKIQSGQSTADRQKAYDTWKNKIDDEKKKIDQLTQDLANAKNSPPSQSTIPVWPYNSDYQQSVAEKQKALDQAKAELDEMEEEARKDGVPASIAQ